MHISYPKIVSTCLITISTDPDFADFSHEIGLASLGASEEEIERLSTVSIIEAINICKAQFLPLV